MRMDTKEEILEGKREKGKGDIMIVVGDV